LITALAPVIRLAKLHKTDSKSLHQNFIRGRWGRLDFSAGSTNVTPELPVGFCCLLHFPRNALIIQFLTSRRQ